MTQSGVTLHGDSSPSRGPCTGLSRLCLGWGGGPANACCSGGLCLTARPGWGQQECRSGPRTIPGPALDRPLVLASAPAPREDSTGRTETARDLGHAHWCPSHRGPSFGRSGTAWHLPGPLADSEFESSRSAPAGIEARWASVCHDAGMAAVLAPWPLTVQQGARTCRRPMGDTRCERSPCPSRGPRAPAWPGSASPALTTPSSCSCPPSSTCWRARCTGWTS